MEHNTKIRMKEVELYIHLMHFQNKKERKGMVAFDAILVGWQR